MREDKRYIFILLFFAFLVEALMIADNILIKFLIDYGTKYLDGIYLAEEIYRIFCYILLVFFGVVLMRVTLRFFQLHINNRLLADVDFRIKKKYFDKVLDFDYEFHVKNKSGALISRLDRGARSCV